MIKRPRDILDAATDVQCLVVTFALIAWIQVWLFSEVIDASPQLTQSDYVIDAYFYIARGQAAANQYLQGTESLLETAVWNRPNIASTGITLANELLALVSSNRYVVAFIQCALMALACAAAWGRRPFIERSIFLIVMGGLLPYVLLPSKESFMLMGFMIFVSAWFSAPRRWGGAIVGIGLMAIARPEVVAILGLALLIQTPKTRAASLILLICGVVGYLSLRDYLMDLVIFNQELAEQGLDDFFCNVGPIAICADSGASFEILALKRILVVTGVPVKWVIDWIVSFGELSPVETLIKTSLVLPLALLWHLRSKLIPTVTQSPVGRFSLLFAALYSASFAAVVFFQPSRQIATAICMLFVAIQSAQKDPHRVRL